MKVGRWDVPTKLFERYVRLIDATERSSKRYDYEFDKERESIHHEIMEHAGILPHMRDDREFQRALRDLCEEMLPDRFPPQKITKLNNPVRGITIEENNDD